MMELLKRVNETKNSKYKSIKNVIKRLKTYVYILSIQDLIIKLLILSALHLGTMKRLFHLRASGY